MKVKVKLLSRAPRPQEEQQASYPHRAQRPGGAFPLVQALWGKPDTKREDPKLHGEVHMA